jgi:antitoxin VapB
MSKQARLFSNGGSQAVRLPAEYRFTGDVVYVRRDPSTGDVILSTRPLNTYAQFMQARTAAGSAPADFLSAAEREQHSELRDPFSDPGPDPCPDSFPTPKKRVRR